MIFPKRFNRRDFLRAGVAGALGAVASRGARGAIGLPPLPRVNGAINVQPLRRLEQATGLTPPLIEPELVDLQLQTIYELGFERMRITISFNRFGSDFLAAIPYVRAARALGIDVLGIVTQFSGFDLLNALSRASTRREVLGAYLTIFDGVVAPATTAVPASGVFSAQVLNEPTHFNGIHPVDYVHEFLAPAYDYLKGDDPNLVVVSAAEVGGVDGVLRMRSMFEAGLERHCDRVAYHVYAPGIVPWLDGLATKPVWITESGVTGVDRHLYWVTQVFPLIRAGIPRVEHIFYFDLFDLEPNGFRLINIERDPEGGYRSAVASEDLYAYLLGRVQEATAGEPHAAYRELIPDITDYFPTEADYRLIASTSYGRKR